MTTSNPPSRKSAFAGLFAFLLLIASASQALAQSTFTWTGGSGTDSNWSTGGNWGGSAPSSPQAVLNFAGSTRTNSNNNLGDWSGGFQIFFNSGAGAFTLTGNAVKFWDWGGTQARIQNDSSNLQTVSFMFGVGNSFGMSLNANTGDLLFNGPAIFLDGNSTLTTSANSGRTITISNAIQNAGGNLYVTGAGTTILTGINTYTGTTTINSGKLQLGDGTTGHDGSIGGSLSIVNNANLTYNLFAAGSYSGAISGTGSVTKIGNAALTLSGTGANTYAGTTTVSGGATSYLNLSKTDGVNAIAGNITIGVGSSAAFVQLMAGNQIADTSLVSLDGIATNARGVLRLNGFSETIGGLSSVVSGGGVVDNNSTTNSTLTLNVVSGSQSFSGQIRNQSSGTLAIVKTGAGTQVLSSLSPVGNNTYTGGTQINGGILQVGSAQALSNSGTISFGGGTLQYSAGGTGTDYSGRFKNSASAITLDTNGQTITLAGVIDSTNTGGLTKNGTGTLVLSGAEAFTGNTTISGGTLQIGNGTTAGSLSSSSAIINNGILVFNRSNTVTAGTDFSGSPISGSGSIVQNGSGKLLLWSGNTFTGGVTINSGTLGIWEGSGLGALPGSPTTQLTFGGNSTLQFQQTPTALPLNANRRIVINPGVTATIDTQSYNPSLAGIISGATGALAKSGSGTLTLYGSNTYGGGTSVSAGTLTLGSSSALGSSTASLAVGAATLNMNAYSATVGALSSTGGIFAGFNLGGGGNALAASSATLSGTTYIGINPSSVTGTGTSNLITSSGGGLTGTFQFAGAQTLSVPVNSLIVKNGSGSFYQVTLNNTATAEQAIVSSAPSKVLSVLPLGASIMAGSSAQTPYSGGGFHTGMYQNLVNDGRFTPNFVGSSTALYAISPTSPNLLTSAGQTNHEGHPGYTTSQILNNLNANDGSTGNNGGFWLSANNTATSGANSPNYIPLNVGGNDFTTLNHVDNLAINRYDAIISQVNTLRPGVDTLATNLMYRSDGGGSVFNLINTYFNPYVQRVVYNHVLAGQNVQFVDLYTLITPGNSTYPANPYISSDGIHPNQAGYNLMGDIFYNSTVYGAAYWTGNESGNWSTLNGTGTNWAMDSARTTDRQALLTNATANTYSYADVYFNGNSSPLATTLGADTTIRSLNFAAGATGSVTVGGNNTLSLGSGGITVQQGTGTHTVSANIILAADQTWGNVSSNNLTVSGVVSGSGNLTIAGSYTVYTGDNSTSVSPTMVTGTGAFVLSGNNTYTGTTTVTSGTLILNGTNSSSGVAVASGATLGGSGRIAGAISGAGQISPGNSPGILAANQVNPSGGLGFAFEFTATGGPAYDNATASLNDVLHLTSATEPFVSDLTGSNAVSIYLNLTTVSAGNTFQGGFFTDRSVDFLSSINSAAFAYYVKGVGGGSHAYNGFTYYTLAEYDAGLSINLSTIQVTSATFAEGTVTNGYISELSVVPEPSTWALLAFSLTTVMVLRRRRRA